MMNKAKAYAFDKVINAVTNANIKNIVLGVTRQGVQNVINNARPFGRVTLVGDTSAVTKLNTIATYADAQATPYINISQEAMNEIKNNGYVSSIMGALVYGMDNAYDLSSVNANNWFDKIMDDRYIYVVPNGMASPIKLWTRGGLTSFTANDATTGKILTRYDLEVAADIAKGEEYKIGYIPRDENEPLAYFLDMGWSHIFECRISGIKPDAHPEHQVHMTIKIKRNMNSLKEG